MGRDDLNDLSREKLEDLVCEWAIRYHELDSKMHTLENELNNRIKTQREKINSLQMELEEEKGKTITLTEGGITMRSDKWEMVSENKALRDENKALKQRLQNMTDVCDGSCFSDYVDLPYGNESEEKDTLVAVLQDQHQQDCIRINDLTTTVHVLAGLYSTLRKTVGMD